MKYLCSTAVLPAFSIKSPQLLADLQSHDIGLKELADRLKLDPGLGARLLHIANSPFFGVCRQISSLNEAVIVLGLNQTRALVQVEIIRSNLSALPWDKGQMQRFWQRSLYMAACCQALANRVGASESTAFTVGIFHNLGILMMAQTHALPYEQLLADCTLGAALAEQEMELFQVDHGVMGAELLQSLNFPDNICDAIAMQYRRSLDDGSNVLSSLLGTAQLLSDYEQWSEFSQACPNRLMTQFNLCEQSHTRVKQYIDGVSSAWFKLAGAI